MGLHASPSLVTPWLQENGSRELELLLRAIAFNSSANLLLVDDGRYCCEASAAAAALLGLPKRRIIGRRIDELTQPAFQLRISELWQAFLERGEQQGMLQMQGPERSSRESAYLAKASVLPARHLLVLIDRGPHAESVSKPADEADHSASLDTRPSGLQDYACYLLNGDGCVAAWHAGAERLYGYTPQEALGRHVSFLYATDSLNDELLRAATEGHLGKEGWHARKDGSPIWANAITLALQDADENLQGFACVIRDFSGRHERDEKLKRSRTRLQLEPPETAVAAVASGEFERILEANDVFLELTGYSREDLTNGALDWPALTPPECAAVDALAQEEQLRFGACTPFEKELIRKDGTRVAVLVATAVVKLCPFSWIAFVQDLRARNRSESFEKADAEVEHGFEEMVGGSTALKRILRQVEVVAPTDATVLILGETGTGKELVARAIHRLSPRHDLPCVTLNCAAIPTGLLESELFGYERGAFTGALSQKIGRFEMAHRGTLFLDEVGDIPLDLQPKLLRALQEKSFERLGGTKTIPIDVRLIAATNRNLGQMMGDKLFRSDLYYRLKVFPITTPPLRDRPEDIPILVRHFTKKYSARMNRKIDKISPETMQALVNWSWPGNIRELENFIERAVILSRGPTLRAPLAEIKPDIRPSPGNSTLEQVEREHILKVFRESGGVVTTAAIRLGLHRTTLNAMMRKLGISRQDL